MENQNHFIANFLTLPGEEFVTAKRKHNFVFIFPLIITSILAGVFVLVSYFFFAFFLSSFPLFLSSVFLIISLSLTIATKTITEWYCHLYILTTHKILEICYAPLYSDSLNDILLDQVRCTEVDTKTDGFIHDLIDMGDIIMTFDRPTHQTEFVFSEIENPREMAKFLCETLDNCSQRQKEPQTLWYKPKNKPKSYSLIEEIFPKTFEGGIK